MTPLPVLVWNTKPYTQNLTVGANWAYAGRYAVHAQQFGAYAINADTGAFRMVSPVTSKGVGFQPAALCSCFGEIHQSAQYIFATDPWIMTTLNSLGSPFGCTNGINPSSVQFYKIGPGGLGYHGQIAGLQSFGSNSAIIDQIAFVDQGDGTWRKIDVENLGDMGPSSFRPPYNPQTSIDGFSYGAVFVTDPPASQHFKTDRQGGPIQMNCFFPLEPVLRQQMAIFLVKLSEWQAAHPGQALVGSATPQLFADVPPEHPFAKEINALGAAGISGGRTCP